MEVEAVDDWATRERRNRERREAWLKALKPGDEVALYSAGHWGTPAIAKVERRTPSGRTFVGGAEFNTDGYERGASYRYRRQIAEPTAEVREEIETKQLRDRLGNVKWDRQPLPVLRAVAAALDALEVRP